MIEKYNILRLLIMDHVNTLFSFSLLRTDSGLSTAIYFAIGRLKILFFNKQRKVYRGSLLIFHPPRLMGLPIYTGYGDFTATSVHSV